MHVLLSIGQVGTPKNLNAAVENPDAPVCKKDFAAAGRNGDSPTDLIMPQNTLHCGTTSCFELSEDSGKTLNPKVPVAAKVDVVVHAKIVLRLPSPKHSRLYERLRVLTLLGTLKP